MYRRGSTHIVLFPERINAAIIFCLAFILMACSRVPTSIPPTELESPPTPTPTMTLRPTRTVVPSPYPDALYIDAGNVLGQISPLVFGANYGPWSVVPLDLMPQAEASGLSYLRFPGGNWGDDYDLKSYHIDQFMVLSAQLGTTPSISVRLRGGSPEQAAELVRYTNLENGYDVRYWGIGNEPGLYGEDYDTVRYNREWRAMAEAMLAVDPDIVLIGPDVTQFTGNPATDPRDVHGKYWVDEFLLANGDLVDIVSIHRYPFPTSLSASGATVADLRASASEMDSIIPNLRALIYKTTGRDLPVAVTEINSHWNGVTGGEATPDSLYNAVWWGDVLGRLIRQRVEAVSYFALQSRNQTGGWGLLSRLEVRPTYYVYQLYQHFGSQLVYASSDDPDLSLYAARCSDGSLTLMVVNLGDQQASQRLLIDGFTPSSAAQVLRLDQDHLAEQLAPQMLSNGDMLTIPPQSLTLYTLSTQGEPQLCSDFIQ